MPMDFEEKTAYQLDGKGFTTMPILTLKERACYYQNRLWSGTPKSVPEIRFSFVKLVGVPVYSHAIQERLRHESEYGHIGRA